MINHMALQTWLSHVWVSLVLQNKCRQRWNSGLILHVYVCRCCPKEFEAGLFESSMSVCVIHKLICISACLFVHVCVGGFGSNERKPSTVCVRRQGMRNPGKAGLCFPQYFHIAVSPLLSHSETQREPPQTESNSYDLRSRVKTLNLSHDPWIPHFSL